VGPRPPPPASRPRPPPPAPPAAVATTTTTTTTTTTQAFADGVSAAHVADAQKHAKYAVSALGFEDVPTAIDNLNKALALLTGVRGLREP
jgi:vacuolar protein sorting-associated protein VTA1